MAHDFGPRQLNQQQTQLRTALESGSPQGISLFLRHHAMLHSARMAQAGLWSYEDELLDGIDEQVFRRIPGKEEHSVAWAIFHIARIEDVAMNLLVAGGRQVVDEGNWLERMKLSVRHTGNAMPQVDVVALSAAIDLAALRDYRVAVGRRTQVIAAGLSVEDLGRRVDPQRLASVMEQDALLPGAEGIAEYWGGRTIAGLLLMPASRHILVHLNEAARLKARRG